MQALGGGFSLHAVRTAFILYKADFFLNYSQSGPSRAIGFRRFCQLRAAVLKVQGRPVWTLVLYLFVRAFLVYSLLSGVDRLIYCSGVLGNLFCLEKNYK